MIADVTAPLPPGPRPASRKKRTLPASTMFAMSATVTAGSLPVKPPIAITGSPVEMMIGVAVIELSVATR